jgi:predicted DCC family thiol-disulfide oxidoreductase YuxK
VLKFLVAGNAVFLDIFVHTEQANNDNVAGWVLYDADCQFCITWARCSQKLLESRQLVLMPLQTPWVRTRLGLPEAQLLAEMRLLLPNGQIYGGADALLEIGRYFWWSRLLARAGHIPWVNAWLHTFYRWVARHRRCGTDACGTKIPAGPQH